MILLFNVSSDDLLTYRENLRNSSFILLAEHWKLITYFWFLFEMHKITGKWQNFDVIITQNWNYYYYLCENAILDESKKLNLVDMYVIIFHI